MIAKILSKLRYNLEESTRAARVIQRELTMSGILDFLRLKGSVALFNPYDDVPVQANKAAFSAGYQECLTDIIDFIDKHLVQSQVPSTLGIQEDYGAVSSLLESGRISQEEADKLRNKK